MELEAEASAVVAARQRVEQKAARVAELARAEESARAAVAALAAQQQVTEEEVVRARAGAASAAAQGGNESALLERECRAEIARLTDTLRVSHQESQLRGHQAATLTADYRLVMEELREMKHLREED